MSIIIEASNFKINLEKGKITGMLFYSHEEMEDFLKLLLGGFLIKNDNRENLIDSIKKGAFQIFLKRIEEKEIKVKEIFSILSLLNGRSKEWITNNDMIKEVLGKKYSELDEDLQIIVSIATLCNFEYTECIMLVEKEEKFLKRERVIKFLTWLKEKSIPILILSSETLGLEMEKLADIVYIVEKNRILDVGSPQDLIKKHVPTMMLIVEYSTKQVNEFIEMLERKRGIKVIYYDDKIMKILAERIEDSFRKVFFSAEQTNTALINIKVIFPTLNEVIKSIRGEKIWE